MLVWFVFVVVATVNLILGIAVAVWMRREIDTQGDKADSSDLKVFSGITPSQVVDSLGQSTFHDDESAGTTPDASVPPLSESDASGEPSAEESSTTEVFGLAAAGDAQPGESTRAQPQADSEGSLDSSDNPQDTQGSSPHSASDSDSPINLQLNKAEDLPAETTGGEPTEAPAASSKPQETSPEGNDALGLSQLIETCSKTIAELIDLFEKTRSQPPVKGEELKSVLEAIAPTMERFSDEYRHVLPGLMPVGQGGSVLDETLACLQEHTLAADQSVERLTLIDHRGDPQVTLQQAQAELGRLISHVQRIRDALESAFVQRLLHSRNAGDIAEKIQHDPLTGLLNRTGVEVFFEKHWGGEQPWRTALSGALLDLDQFRQINQEYGYPLGDDILKALANLLRELVPREAVLARYRGDQFLVLKSDSDARQFIRAVEQIRQSLEVAKFQSGNRTISLTLSCGVTESRSDDTAMSFCERLDEAVYEAKRAGGNRTFIHNGEFAQSIIPHNLKVTEREVSLAGIS
jgi:diguanylate cyclase (GGDEF)-like protein